MRELDCPVVSLLAPDPLLPAEEEAVGLTLALEHVPHQGERRHHHGPADVSQPPHVHLVRAMLSELLVDINQENLLVSGYQVHQERMIGVGEEEEVCSFQSVICFLSFLSDFIH